MACKESICRNCFHSYVCEQFNENKDDNNERCHFANDHYIPRTDVVPKSEVENYIQIAEKQQSLATDRYFEIKRLKEELETVKSEVAGEISTLVNNQFLRILSSLNNTLIAEIENDDQAKIEMVSSVITVVESVRLAVAECIRINTEDEK